ncbi:hypothetical protein [Kitasatospora azatica]|uniref:hypothetical protein n=1 Tax=Kitasatospora azatica TaxID=58347 RepID=UPI000566D87E|nr:hypothetical protein [Kitasatospora azatica]
MSFWDIPGQIRQAITGWLADLIRPLVNPLINSVVRALLTTPDPASSPRIRELWEAMRVIAVAGYGLFVLAAGITTMTHGSIQQRWGVQDLLPRLVLGIAASNLSLTICTTLLELTNAIAAAIFGDGVSADDVAGTLIGLLLAQLTGDAPLYILVIQLVALTLGAVLLITVLVRTAAIILLTVASPLMLACHAHPLSDGVARLWWRAYLGCLGTEIAQAIAFLVCVKALLDPNNYGLVTLGATTQLINLMLLCCTLYLLIKIPSWIRRIVTAPARTITGSAAGPKIPGLRILRKVALGALGMPLGPYAFGAKLATGLRIGKGATRAAKAARTATAATGTGRTRPRRNGPGGAGPGGPGTTRGPGGPSTGPTGGRPGPSPGGAPRPGNTPPPTGGPGTAPGPGGPPGNGPGGANPAPAYQWGRPRRHAPGNRLNTPTPPPTPGSGPGLPPGNPGGPGNRPGASGPPIGPGGPGARPPRPLPGGTGGNGRTVPLPPAVRPNAASNLRPARANLPPPLPRPAVLRPPMDDHPPGTRRKRNPS